MPDNKDLQNKDILSFSVKLIHRKESNSDFQRSDYWEYCDNCGHRLIARKCELICPKCGFLHSCSEP